LGSAIEESERLRRLPDNLVEELRDRGFFRLMQPRRFGGQELGFDALVELGIEAGRVGGSFGWLAIVLNTGWMLGTFPDRAQRDVWEDCSGDALAATAFAPTTDVDVVPGGYRISGRWSFCSGIHHADFVMVGGLVCREDGLDYRLFLLPKCDYRVDDDWHSVGLRATGSASLVAANVHVPDHRTVALSDLREGRGPGAAANGNSLYAIPLGHVFPINLASPVVGMAEGALRIWKDWMRERRYNGVKRASHYTPLQVRAAESYAEVDCAAMLLRRSAAESMQFAAEDRKPSLSDRARSWRDGAYAAQLSMRAIDRLFNASGGAACYDSHPLQRTWRDLHAAMAHVSLRWDEAAERFGRDLFGLEPNNEFFF
jgi:alkylation response protein AidB-like acyl-CoA dehydrogenase